MPFPRRRNASKSSLAFSISKIPSLTLKLFDANFMFQSSRKILYYGFAPAVILIGMMTEPRPASWLELINILE